MEKKIENKKVVFRVWVGSIIFSVVTISFRRWVAQGAPLTQGRGVRLHCEWLPEAKTLSVSFIENGA
ncbi:MAG: hypothetical protein ACE5L7_03365 [Candidatus Aminicenantales bacterium]